MRRELAEKRDEARELRFKLAQGEMKNVRSLRAVKKGIAQILTILNAS
ncbi:MAG: 50S ribosomal protein L29 [bacterium]|nr:50S ribosomal protein L29 [bacterium]